MLTFVNNLLIGFKSAEKVFNEIEIGTPTGIITGTAIEVPTIPNSEIAIKIPSEEKYLII